MDREGVKRLVRAAFAHVEYPGDQCLRGGDLGDEPYRVEREFKGKSDWRTLDAEFLNSAPAGLGSALSFFSHEAFHFYLPAYLIADLDGLLGTVDPVHHLCHGVDGLSRDEVINPNMYGEKTWFDYACERFALFDTSQAQAVVAYLLFKRDEDDLDREGIEEVLANYWRGKAISGHHEGDGSDDTLDAQSTDDDPASDAPTPENGD